MSFVSFVFKELTPFVGLIVTTYLVVKANSCFVSAKEDKKRISAAVWKNRMKLCGVVGCVVVFFAFLALVNFPRFLKEGNADVLVAKQTARDECKRALSENDYAKAESWIRNRTLGTLLHKRKRSTQRTSLDGVFQAICEKLFFQVGAVRLFSC